MAANNKSNQANDLEVEVLPALSKKQKKALKKIDAAKDHDYQVANIATAASDMVGKRTNGVGGFAAYIGIHAIDFLLGSSGSDSDSKKKKKKKKKNKKKGTSNDGN